MAYTGRSKKRSANVQLGGHQWHMYFGVDRCICEKGPIDEWGSLDIIRSSAFSPLFNIILENGACNPSSDFIGF